jgi:hypothetical protein
VQLRSVFLVHLRCMTVPGTRVSVVQQCDAPHQESHERPVVTNLN